MMIASSIEVKSSPLLTLPSALVRFNHVASFIINANQSIILAVAFSGCSPRILARFAYTFLSKPKARSCRVQVSRDRSKRLHA
jgi:hypothetical protein